MSNEIGPVYVPEEKSAETRKLIDTEVTKILREAHSRVTSMLVRLEAWRVQHRICSSLSLPESSKLSLPYDNLICVKLASTSLSFCLFSMMYDMTACSVQNERQTDLEKLAKAPH